MGVGANSNGNKALNERAERAAGRQADRGPQREAILDASGVDPGKGKGRAGGAFGKEGKANRQPGNTLGEGGGGGGASGNSRIADVGAAKRRAKKRT